MTPDVAAAPAGGRVDSKKSGRFGGPGSRRRRYRPRFVGQIRHQQRDAPLVDLANLVGASEIG